MRYQLTPKLRFNLKFEDLDIFQFKNSKKKIIINEYILVKNIIYTKKKK